MTLLIVLLAGFAVAAAALCWRNRRRWWHIRARPVLTCEQLAGLPPGQFVVLTGRTSDGPLMASPHTGRVCEGTTATSIARDLHISSAVLSELVFGLVVTTVGGEGSGGSSQRPDLHLVK